MIELDGSHGEGGGQILRTALALAMCTGVPLRIDRIRAKRAKPGLMRQHLTCVLTAQEVCGATVIGAELGSEALEFRPGRVHAGDYRFAVGTAGSCTLVLQTVLPPLMLADATSRIHLSGGTHNPMAPPFHFLQRAFAPLVRKAGAGLDLTLRRHGFFPAGGGEIEAVITPAADGPRPFDLLDRGALLESYAEVVAPALPRNVASRELDAIGQTLGWDESQLRVIHARQNEGPGNALMATLAHEHLTDVFIAFGERGLSAEEVARALAAEVRAYQASTGAVGPHLADQLALPLALAVAASGRAAQYTCTDVTEHARTNFTVIERFLDVRFESQLELSRGGNAWRVTVAPA
ncbi:RNA 3'-phosphate cyclase [Roseateles aquatilis]|uniref:RNA 3'-terminal phosphate cyclase n=1 Tax=Roseateles aquatilis TaxID=431061 RepID=A0A246JCM8_9BURK|nr:RNA 3'-terminal phosphate cyclase [Roseateles aquatilis]OWQ90344.1 RNA 3'-phosphate cyclase [Roseateles aquatilis]